MRYISKMLVLWIVTISYRQAAADCERAKPPPKQSSAPNATQYTVSLRVDLQPKLEVGARSLMPGETARAGDRFTLTAWSDQPVYLYVVGYEPEGWSTLMFPNSNHTLVQKGEQVHLPSSGNPYKLNNETGEVKLYVYASPRPIDGEACMLLRLPCPLSPQGTSRGDDSDKKKEPPPPPAGRNAKDREGKLVSNAKERIVNVKSDERGTALLGFFFRHVP